MPALTKEQKAAKAARAKALSDAGLTEEQFAALSEEEQAKLLADAGISPADEGIAFVQMKRDPESYSAPHSAQVHPDEVENYAVGGWEVDDAHSSTAG